MRLRYTVILLPEEEGGFSVSCPALPGCVSQGETKEEALANIREAAEGWMQVELQTNPVPPEETAQKVGDELIWCVNDRAAYGLALLLETQQIDLQIPARV